MADLKRHSALENCTLSVPGISELPYRAIVQINGAPEDLHKRLRNWNFKTKTQTLKAVAGKDTGLLWNGPGQFLLVSAGQSAEELCGILAEQLQDSDATWVDLSHARTVFELSGPHAQDILAKGCALDVDAMQAGDCVPTLLAHLNVLLYCRAQQSFQIFVFRSFGFDCMEWLAHTAREFQD